MSEQSSGEAYTFGCGRDGCLGHGDEVDQLLPVKVQIPTPGASSSSDEGNSDEGDSNGNMACSVVAVAAGAVHSLFLLSDSACSVFSCGNGEDGQLGHGTPATNLNRSVRE